MVSNTSVSRICPILSMANAETRCLGEKCMLYCEVVIDVTIKEGLQTQHFCAISLSALALDKAAREASKYT